MSMPTHKFYPLALAAATHTFAAAIPFSCMPVLFAEISADLNLSIVQIGVVWGMLGLAGVFVSLPGGILGDRFGVNRVLGLLCILGGVAGAARGYSSNFFSLTATVFAFGIIRAMMPINVHKAVGLWFQGRDLGTANGVVSMGMGLGLMLGPMISATVLSPLLGGWKPVLFLYGAVSIFIGVLWLVRWNKDDRNVGRTQQLRATQFREGIADLVRAKSLWLIGLALLFRSGGTIGFVGYLPLYLRQIGWDGAYADGALAAFFAISTLAVIPISFLSDRIHSRKTILFLASTTGIFGIGLIPLARGLAVWVLVLAVGLFFDAFMSVIVTLAQETKGVGLTYPGMTLGLIFTFSQVGSFIAPPLGNSLSSFHPGLPFLFWSLLSLFIVIALIPVKEDARRSSHS